MSERDLRTYAWDKIELLYKGVSRAEARASMIQLDLFRAANASVVSKEGHKLYTSLRKMLQRMSKEDEGLKPEQVRKKVAQKIIAMGGLPMQKPS